MKVYDEIQYPLERGSKDVHLLKVCEMWDSSSLYIPVITACGLNDGPTLVLVASVMGDEIAGIQSCRQMPHEIDPNELSGNLVSIPIANPSSAGVSSHPPQRGSPLDFMILNRVFPGRADGYPTERVAHTIFERIIRKVNADFVVAFHGGGPYCESLPATYLTETSTGSATDDLALAFGQEVNSKLFKKATTTEEPGRLSKTLDACCGDHGIPAIIADFGGWGTRTTSFDWVKVGNEGIKNIMRYYKMIPGTAKIHPKAKIYSNRLWIRSDHGGFLRNLVELGDRVIRGQNLCIVEDVFGREVERITSPEDAIVQMIRTYPMIGTGEDLFLIVF